MVNEEKKKSILEILKTGVQEKVEKRRGAGFVKGISHKTRMMIAMWVVCIALIFFIVPLIIGMMLSGFVDLSNPAATIVGLTIAIIIILVGGILP